MLTGIVMIMVIMDSKVDSFVVKVLQLHKKLPEQSPTIRFVKVKFLSNFVRFVLRMIEKQPTKMEHFTEVQLSSFSFHFC